MVTSQSRYGAKLESNGKRTAKNFVETIEINSVFIARL